LNAQLYFPAAIAQNKYANSQLKLEGIQADRLYSESSGEPAS
jgi:hypothetical protein